MGGNMGKNIRNYLCFLALILSFLTLPCVIATAAPALQDEKITNFDVDITFAKNGDADITEKIIVNALNIQIRHGIFREIPKYYMDGEGNKIPLILQFGNISQDGKVAKFKRTDDSNYYRVQIGDPNSYVIRGTHQYFINYRVKNSIWRGADHDEFYWNVTGNGWPFYIDEATVRLNFPKDVNVLGSTVYTGKAGSQASNANSAYKDTYFSAQTTRTLAPREGMTIAVAIPKNSIGESSKFYLIAAVLGYWIYYFEYLAVVIPFMLITWFLFGREKPGVIIPRFEPPANMSADELNYLVNQGYDKKTFSTYIIAAATAGIIKIEQDLDKKLTILTKPDHRGNMSANTSIRAGNASEATQFKYGDIITKLFVKFNAIILKKKPNPRDPMMTALRKVMKAHRSTMSANLKNLINPNRIFHGITILMAVLFGFTIYALDSNKDEADFITTVLALSAAGVYVLYDWAIKKYTTQGQALADEAAGFKMFLKAAEEARLNVLYPKHITPQMFEKYLPYAYALGVDQQWCEQFAKQINIDEELQDPNLWGLVWVAHAGRSLDIAALSTSLQSIEDVISASTVSPKSSGSSSGGGSSGGGGGGGGGGGW